LLKFCRFVNGLNQEFTEALADTSKVPIAVDIGVLLDWPVSMAVDSGVLVDFKLLLFFLNAVG
jgi:hypothetical protein